MVLRLAGLVVIAVGAYLVMSPLVVAELLSRPHDTSTQMINLRASWGGTLVGIGAFVAWLPSLRTWTRRIVALLGCAMAGIGVARLVGFALDGDPDTRQFVWISAEAAIVVVCAIVLRVSARGTTSRPG
ncbi:MAG TPA: DUF4345 family protein [Kofleriaceae bacterium]|jgi:uncharacterized protein YjeT (DUF2065 family)|nr:DUF4345 family protein [Kofleriaceae bacterium]